MPITTTAVITAPVNVIFQTTLLRNAKAYCPYFAGTVPASIQEHQGTFTARWRRIENLSVPSSPLAELSGAIAFPTRNPVTPTITDVSATVVKFGNFIYLTEEVDLVNFTSQADKLAEILGINAGQALNRQTRNTMEDNSTQILTGATVTTATSIPSGATASGFISNTAIAQAFNALARQNALVFRPMTTGAREINTTPIRPSYVGFCHVDTVEDLRTLTQFVDVSRYGPQTEVWPNEIGNVGGVRFIMTTEASIDTGSGVTATGLTSTGDGRSATANRTDVYNTVIMGQEAVGTVGFGFEHITEVYKAGDELPGVQMISHGRGSAGAADPLNELSSMGWKSWHASTILNSNWIVNLRHPVTRLAPNT